jgi:hypothetical protein
MTHDAQVMPPMEMSSVSVFGGLAATGLATCVFMGVQPKPLPHGKVKCFRTILLINIKQSVARDT